MPGSGEAIEKATRLDKWLWAARFYKTRSIATKALKAGKVKRSSQPLKPSSLAQVGDELSLSLGQIKKTVVIQALSSSRGSAKIAQTLYSETTESIRLSQLNKLENQAHRLQHRFKGRPTKKSRRSIIQFTQEES